jgi:hypothetical protein
VSASEAEGHRFESCRARQIPPFAAVYTREPSGVRQLALAATPCSKYAPTASGDGGFAAHLSRRASLSPGLRVVRSRRGGCVGRPGYPLASQSDAVWDFSVGQLKRHRCLSFRSDQRFSNGGFVGRLQPGEDRPPGAGASRWRCRSSPMNSDHSFGPPSSRISRVRRALSTRVYDAGPSRPCGPATAPKRWMLRSGCK